MLSPAEFRTGQHSIPFHMQDELPDCCGRCPYLIYEEFSVCFIDDPFYFHCAYSWPTRINDQVPPCLAGGREG